MTAADEPVALIGRLFDAFNAGDIDGMIALSHPDSEVYPMRAQLEGRGYHGHEGLRAMMADLGEDWEDLRMEVQEARQAGEGTVAIIGRLRGCGRASGVDVAVPMGWVWKIRDGKVAYARAYSKQEDALRAAGLE